MNFIKIDGDKLIISDNDVEAEFSMTERFGTNEVVCVEDQNTGGNNMVDVIHLSNGKVVVVSDEVIGIWPNVKGFYDSWIGSVVSEEEVGVTHIAWYNDAKTNSTDWTKQHKIDALVEVFDNWNLSPTDIVYEEIWDKCIHEEMHNTGVLPIPFKMSLDEYNEWEDIEGINQHYRFNNWLKSIAYSIGWRRYITIDDRDIIIPGLCKLIRAEELIDGKVWIDEVHMLPGMGKDMFDCGANLWYDFLPTLAVEINVDQNQLQYCMASAHALDRVYYDKERWMPEHIKLALRLAMAEGFTKEELADNKYLDGKYETWLDNGLLG